MAEEIRFVTQVDNHLNALIIYLINSWSSVWTEVKDKYSYWVFWDDTAVIDGIEMKSKRIMVLGALQQRTLKELHINHFGAEKKLDYWHVNTDSILMILKMPLKKLSYVLLLMCNSQFALTEILFNGKDKFLPCKIKHAFVRCREKCYTYQTIPRWRNGRVLGSCVRGCGFKTDQSQNWGSLGWALPCFKLTRLHPTQV